MSKTTILARQVFPIDLHLHGCSFDLFERGAKDKIVRTLVEDAGNRLFAGRFTVENLHDHEVFEQVNSCQRADGQFVVSGNFVPREYVEELVRNCCKAVLFVGYIERDADNE